MERSILLTNLLFYCQILVLKINKKFSGNEKFDLVVSNPPYLLKNEINTLMPEVLYEPKESLYDNKDGLSFYKRILNYVLKTTYLNNFSVTP